jgi:hypothetical protein
MREWVGQIASKQNAAFSNDAVEEKMPKKFQSIDEDQVYVNGNGQSQPNESERYEGEIPPVMLQTLKKYSKGGRRWTL